MSAPAMMPAQGTPEMNSPLKNEITVFRDLCLSRYRFNNNFDVALTVTGICMGIAVVAAGTYQAPRWGAILGAMITALVSAQRAFPFTQRAQFYRSLVGQSDNLKSSLDYNLISTVDAVKVLETLRLDFAQQLPRGTTSDAPKNPPTQSGGPGPQIQAPSGLPTLQLTK